MVAIASHSAEPRSQRPGGTSTAGLLQGELVYRHRAVAAGRVSFDIPAVTDLPAWSFRCLDEEVNTFPGLGHLGEDHRLSHRPDVLGSPADQNSAVEAMVKVDAADTVTQNKAETYAGGRCLAASD